MSRIDPQSFQQLVFEQVSMAQHSLWDELLSAQQEAITPSVQLLEKDISNNSQVMQSTFLCHIKVHPRAGGGISIKSLYNCPEFQSNPL